MLLIESRRVSRTRLWVQRAIVLAVAALAIGAWLAYRPAVDRYKRWKQERALGQAREFIAKRDAPNAQLALEVALNAGPTNLDAIRTAAEMLEQVGAPQAMRLRRAIVRGAPDSAEDAAALVLCCLKFRDLNAAKDTLAAFRPAFADHPAALRAALAFAIATNDAPVIDFIYGQLEEKFPDDQDLKVSHALLHLRHPDETRRTTARRELEKIAQENPQQTLRIHREFAAFAVAAHDHAEARKWLTLVNAHASATLGDRLQLANLDLLIEKQPFDAIFARLAPTAGGSEADAVQFLQWLLVQNRAAEADRWLANLAPSIRSQPSVNALQTEIAAQLKDWDRFIAQLRDGAWGPISKETLRLVDAAQAISDRDRPALRRETWDLAVQSAGGHLGTLTALHRTAAMWSWAAETERTLWAIVRAFPDQTWAHQALFDQYAAKKDTAGMRDVMSALQQSDASVPRYQHDWALLTLLTSPSTTPNAAKDVMQKLYESAPTNPNYATGHAFSLAQSRRAAEAMAVVEKMSELDRNYVPRQPYLAFVYGVARDAEALEKAAKLAAGATFLPEEQRLFERAREELVRKPDRPANGAKTPPSS